MFSNTWAVKIRGGPVVLERLARKHGFVNETQVVSDYYVFDHKMVPLRSSSSSPQILKELLAEPEVLWAEQQVIRPIQLYSIVDEVVFTDPKWKDQWYMMRDDGPTYNVLDVWRMGYTGKGVVVAVVDEGLEKNHQELKQNYDQEASFDFIENDADPSSSNPMDSVGHGIKCAGVIAAVANNSFCGVGIAYSANIGGIRILKGGVTDELQAKGLGFRQDYVDIYSNSWGPGDKGDVVAEAGVMTAEVLNQGALKGRKGLGSIFVFGVGNGGYADDCCSFNGLVNSIYTIAITGVNKDGSVPRYGERCPGILAVTYSKEIFAISDNTKVITATHNGGCTDSFSASSAATAMASGLIALAVEANKNLTWRDVQHIIIRSSRADSRILQAKDWTTNTANLTASNYVGFGLMDAYRLVSLAKNWTTVPPQLNCTISHGQINRVIPSVGALTLTASTLSCAENKIKFLEHVQVRVNLNFTRRGDLEMNLTSPWGTTSRLTQYRPKDNNPNHTSLSNWTILTLHHWGENPSGVWKLTLKNSQLEHMNTGILFDWALILYGTATDPLASNVPIPLPTGTTPPPPASTGASTKPTSETSTAISGAVAAGITFAVVAFIAIVAIVSWFFYKRRCKIAFSNPSAPSQQQLEKAGPAEEMEL